MPGEPSSGDPQDELALVDSEPWGELPLLVDTSAWSRAHNRAEVAAVKDSGSDAS